MKSAREINGPGSDTSARSEFRTTEIALAAFLQALGHEAEIIRPDTPSDFFAFAFRGDPESFKRLAEEFAAGGSVPAVRFYSAINALRGEIRLARGGWK